MSPYSISTYTHSDTLTSVFTPGAVNSIVLCRSQTAASGILFDVRRTKSLPSQCVSVCVDQLSVVILYSRHSQTSAESVCVRYQSDSVHTYSRNNTVQPFIEDK